MPVQQLALALVPERVQVPERVRVREPGQQLALVPERVPVQPLGPVLGPAQVQNPWSKPAA